MNRDLFYLGLTQQSTPLPVREQVRADRETQILLLSQLGALASGRVILSTCERFEVYATTSRSDPAEWLGVLSQGTRLPAAAWRRFASTRTGPWVARHLLRVAGGLESRILGERQILGQVRNAFRLAQEQNTLDAPLSTLVRTAIRTGKRVRQETPIGSAARSIVTMAMDWLSRRHGGLTEKAVGVVGSGRLAALVVAEIAQRRPRRIVVVARNQVRAAELARPFGAACVGMDALAQTVGAVDVAITCTTSPTYLIDPPLVGDVRRHPLLLVDLSVPRNVDPRVVRLPGVGLGHLDELVISGLRAGAVPGSGAIQQAEQIVQEELHAFLQWRRERRVAPMIAELLRRATDFAMDKRTLHDQIMLLKSGVAV